MKVYQKHRSKLIISAVAIVVVALLVILYLIFVNKPSSKTGDQSAKTTSSSKTAQSDYSTGGAHSQSTSNNSTGTSVDKGGQTTATTIDTPSSQWSTSKSGLITVKQPAVNSTLKSGDTLRGSSQTSSVNYTLADNVSGLVSQGTLSVVNGDFSGILSFTHRGTSGQLSVFTFDPSTGAETNVINIPVNF